MRSITLNFLSSRCGSCLTRLLGTCHERDAMSEQSQGSGGIPQAQQDQRSRLFERSAAIDDATLTEPCTRLVTRVMLCRCFQTSLSRQATRVHLVCCTRRIIFVDVQGSIPFFLCSGPQVVEKLNLLESSNGTVLHSEIVGAIKMKVLATAALHGPFWCGRIWGTVRALV